MNYKTMSHFYMFLALTIILGISSEAPASNSDPNDLYDIVVKGILENSRKLTSASLVWHKTEKINEPNSTHPEMKGTYQLWWDGQKLATKSDYDVIFTNPEGIQQIRRSGRHKVYDGKEFRTVKNVTEPRSIGISNNPNFDQEDNWFVNIRWPGNRRSIIEMLNHARANKELQQDWSFVEKDGLKLIKHFMWNINKNIDTYEVEYYDPSKGFNLVCYEAYYEGKMRLKKTIGLNQVKGGAWFPVETDLTSSLPDSDTAIIYRTMKIDLEKSAFNNISAIPPEVFEIEITDNMKIHDHRSEPPSLIGNPLPELKNIGIDLLAADVNDNMLLVCFFDFQQRPSRNCIILLNQKAQEIKAKGVTIIAVQASKAERAKLNEWITENDIAFPVGTDEEITDWIMPTNVKNNTPRKPYPLPWLILADKQYIVRAEGFNINELDEKLKRLAEK